MTARESLPQRRQSATTTLEHGGHAYEVTVGRYQDGRPGEIFVNGGKTPEATQQVASDAAVILSVALQYGTPAGAFAKSMPRFDSGEPYTVIGRVADMLAAEPGAAP